MANTIDTKPATTAEDVAKFFIQYYNDNDLVITNRMLNKLLYLAQGHCLAEYGRPLFKETIEAWDYGPVVYDIYRKYKVCGKKAPLQTTDVINYGSTFSDDVTALLVAVARQYKHLSDYGLVTLSHEKNSPWDKAYIKGKKHTQITNESIANWFSNSHLNDFEEDEELTSEEITEIQAASKAYKEGKLETFSFDECVG